LIKQCVGGGFAVWGQTVTLQLNENIICDEHSNQ